MIVAAVVSDRLCQGDRIVARPTCFHRVCWKLGKDNPISTTMASHRTMASNELGRTQAIWTHMTLDYQCR